jgi:hypothetical protein
LSCTPRIPIEIDDSWFLQLPSVQGFPFFFELRGKRVGSKLHITVSYLEQLKIFEASDKNENAIKSFMLSGSIMIIHDITYNDGMRKAWHEIINDPEVRGFFVLEKDDVGFLRLNSSERA